jgi:hypothetical protein
MTKQFKIANTGLIKTTRLAKRLRRAVRRVKDNGYLQINGGYDDVDGVRVVLVPHGYYYADARSRCSQVIDISSKAKNVWHFHTGIGKAKPHLF